MKKKLATAGQFFSIAQLATCLYFIYVIANDKIRTDWLKEAKFGSDYNTYSYAAARASAQSTADIGYLLKDMFIFIAIVLAILAIIEFIYFYIKKCDCIESYNKA